MYWDMAERHVEMCGMYSDDAHVETIEETD